MSRTANAARGEASFRVGDATLLLRPSFAALVAAEGELGPLFELADRAAEGRISLSEIVILFDHLSSGGRPSSVDRAAIGEALVTSGLAAAMPPLRAVLVQLLQGR
ncbi:GTA-gp10 family protein [Sphingomicrobium aestuariivivum]|uniref:GTA-gp10 family protein n=1 Tax=Sphingomicrobium aestuariivivum TaxID=1582356 RepID=UPI001FD6D11A|nr:GTA-gp10 family protein [Sphingomicrobium aestuariivivum]MCJ8191778.1 gene transfer agent family protein [Sphingomicrobium aestuariivivum]